MRVIAGKLGGRHFSSSRGHRTHPMSEKMRGALFNALGDLTNLTVLDAYAGTGALSFEAVSRGAASAVAIDIDKQAYETIVSNISDLNLSEHIIALRKNISGWSRNNRHKSFDLILVDPPYDDINPKAIENLFQLIAPTGTLALSWPGNEAVREFAKANVVLAKNYGDSQLVFYKLRPVA